MYMPQSPITISLLVPVDFKSFEFERTIENFQHPFVHQKSMRLPVHNWHFKTLQKRVDFFSYVYHEMQDRMTDIYIF